MTTPEQIRDLENQILAVAVERGADSLRQSRMLLVLDELLTNVRLYAYPKGPGPVQVDILPASHDDDDLMLMRINDWGPFFDPLREMPSPDISAEIDERQQGGLGLFLVSNMVCGLRYERVGEEPPSDGRNQLSLGFPLSQRMPK
jgi:anti-sigma regulatory factor (Ser/Thr protein kinase)